MIAISHFPLNVSFLPFVTLGNCSSINHFVPDSEVSSSHLLFDMKSDSDLPFQNHVQNQRYRNTVTCLPHTHTEQGFAKVADGPNKSVPGVAVS